MFYHHHLIIVINNYFFHNNININIIKHIRVHIECECYYMWDKGSMTVSMFFSNIDSTLNNESSPLCCSKQP